MIKSKIKEKGKRKKMFNAELTIYYISENNDFYDLVTLFYY